MKDVRLKIARLILLTAALGQLASSQIHIGIITKIFEPSIGFFLFLFITFGVVLSFLSTSFKHGSNPVLLILALVAAVGTGVKYVVMIIQDVQMENLLTFAEVRLSLFISITVIALFIFSSIGMIAVRNMDD